MQNWRDYGGYRGDGSELIIRDNLFRCAAPASLTEADRRSIEAISFAAVIDLRGVAERRHNPTFWPGFTVPVLTVDSETAGHFQLPESTTNPIDAAVAREAMLTLYAEMPYRPTLLPAYRAYFRTLAIARGPTLVYCSAGKDRTGLAVALLQHLLGAHDDDIMREYLLSNAANNSEAARTVLKQILRTRFNVGLTADGLLAFGSVSANYLQTAMAAIVLRSGSIDAYLQDTLGVTRELRTAIRRRLLG